MTDERDLVSDLSTTPRQPTEITLVQPTQLSDEEVLSRLRAVDRIGRFTCLRRLGEGGMGIVTLAYDEELDRKVALKMIRQGFCDQPEPRRRFFREAQSLARLSHPNVVTIYEVGEYLGRPYLAMEYVDGCDLRGWLRRGGHSPQEILRVFVDAGRGLAAAHAAGLVHRDFKPANVLVGVDGRARVLDFGLSRAADVLDAEGRPRDTLTIAGTVIGTPAYMSPEQLLGQPLDARSDQYAFAVALYEGLVGARPFRGKTLPDRLGEGFTFVAPPGTPLSKPVLRALQRALAEAPGERFANMDALLAALTADPWRRWRRVAGVVALAGAAGGVGYGLTAGEPCTSAAAQLAGVWDPDTRALVRAALLPDAAADPAGADRLTGHLDAYTDAWAASHHDACIAHHRGESSAEALDVRMRCLGQARLELVALVDTLRRSGPEDLDGALVDANALRDARACLDLDAGSSGPPPPPAEIAAEVEELQGKLARAALAHRREDAEAARAEVVQIVERARALAYRPLVARSFAVLGNLETELADYAAAATDLEAALWENTVIDDPARTAENMSSLLYVLGVRLGRDDLAGRWRAHADALAERLGPGADGTARLASTRGAIALRHGRIEEALAEQRRAVALAEASHGPDHLNVGSNLANLAAALGTAGQYEAAMRVSERALAILERAYGPDHVGVITALGNLGNLHTKLGDPAKAIAIGQEALVRVTRSRGEEHPMVAVQHQNLGFARIAAGQLAQGRGDLLHARAIQRERLGAHRELHATLSGLVETEMDLGDLASARFHAVELVDVALAIFAADTTQVLEAFATAIDVEVAADATAAALALAERGLARPLERGLREEPDLVAYLRFHVARGLRELGRDPGRVAELAASAQPVLALLPDIYAEELEELAAWRKAPRRRRR